MCQRNALLTSSQLAMEDKCNGIYTVLLSVGRYPALIWQSPMNAMCWLGSRIYHGKVIVHPAEPGVLCLLRQVGRIRRELFCQSFQLVFEDKKKILSQQDG